MKSILAFTTISLLFVLVSSYQEEAANMNDIGADDRQSMRCVSESDCQQDECSVMGMQRYSEPRCEARGGLNAPCIVDNEPENKTLAFPNGSLMECQTVYMQFCPCSSGLVCHQNRCQRPRRPFRGNARQWSKY